MAANLLHVGDRVIWRGGFGDHPPVDATVMTIEAVEEEGQKHGTPVSVIDWRAVTGRRVVVDLDNGHWAYGEQLQQGGTQ